MSVVSRVQLWLSLAALLLPASAARAEPVTAWVLRGGQPAYRPVLSFEPRGMALSVPFRASTRVEGLSALPVDASGAELDRGVGVNLMARVGLSFNSRLALIPFNFGVDYEHDLVTGPAAGRPDLEGDHLPGGGEVEHQLRKASARASLGYFLHLIGGLTTSHFGMGLLANDGDHGWQPGSARFADPRGGDRTARVALASGPVTHMRLFFAVGHDWVQDDDTMVEGDRSSQWIGTFIVGRDMPTTLGFYAVRRSLEAKSGATLDVWAVDMHGRTSHELGQSGLRLEVEAEAALILGETTLTSTVEYPTQDVFQLGAAARAGLHASRWGAVLDLLYASGDANYDDNEQNGFKTDPNYELGLLLHRQVLAAMTGRAAYTAADPELSGYPTRGLERLPTRGGLSNTVLVFPRGYWRPLAGLEIYGGPLFAFVAAELADPLNTKLAGGAVRNALDGAPGRYLGTELDLGARMRTLLWGTELTAGLEGALLLPGSALDRTDGSTMDPVAGGRLVLDYRF